MRNDGKNFLVIVSPKDLTNEAKLQKAEAEPQIDKRYSP